MIDLMCHQIRRSHGRASGERTDPRRAAVPTILVLHHARGPAAAAADGARDHGRGCEVQASQGCEDPLRGDPATTWSARTPTHKD